MSWRHDHGRTGGRRPLSAVELQKMGDAGRAALRDQLTDDGFDELTIDRWIAAWRRHETQGPSRQLWSAAYRWILGQIALGAEPD